MRLQTAPLPRDYRPDESFDVSSPIARVRPESAADLASVAWLLGRPRSVYVWDQGPTMIVYAPA
jgi:hypothetical protein